MQAEPQGDARLRDAGERSLELEQRCVLHDVRRLFATAALIARWFPLV